MGHDHHHHHDHAGGRIGVAFLLNVVFTLIEFVGAWYTGSTAIAADALHDLGDSLSLGFAWGMQRMAGRRPTEAYTYGFRRLSLLGALVNAIVLLVGGAIVLRETVPRLWNPVQPDATGMLVLAILGVLVNGAAVLRVRHGTSLNERVVTWHLLEDVLGWVAVLIVSIVMMFVDVPVLDPLLSIGITLWVAWNAARNLRKTLDVFLQRVPEDVDVSALHTTATGFDGVRALRHVHVWSQEGEHHVLTGQLLIDDMPLQQALDLRNEVRRALQARGMDHVTLELCIQEDGEGSTCR